LFVFGFDFRSDLLMEFQSFKGCLLDENGHVVDGDLVEFGYIVYQHFISNDVTDAPSSHGEGFRKAIS
jgi:hypothetical protein